jgi:hypothetical protein
MAIIARLDLAIAAVLACIRTTWTREMTRKQKRHGEPPYTAAGWLAVLVIVIVSGAFLLRHYGAI